MTPITFKELEKVGYVRKAKIGTTYYQKGIIILVYRDSGVWEFCAEQGTEMSDGIPVTTFEDIAFYSKK